MKLSSPGVEGSSITTVRKLATGNKEVVINTSQVIPAMREMEYLLCM